MAETAEHPPADRIPAGLMPAWDVGDLPPPPVFRWRKWTALIGPGLMMAGANIGGGEWLFGPAVTAQYGGTVMWIASVSIILQVFYNLEVMRYTLYCGEPIAVGFFRTLPGPRFWTVCYLILDFGAIWPYLASNAAVPLAAAFLGHLPGPDDSGLVRGLGYAIFVAAFIPLIFGGKIYNALEKVMVAKIILVLGYLTFIAVFVCSTSTATEIFGGFFRFGSIPLRAQTVIVGERFTIQRSEAGQTYVLKGTLDQGEPSTDTSLTVGEGSSAKKYQVRKNEASGRYVFIDDANKREASAELQSALAGQLEKMLNEARRAAGRSGFVIEHVEGSLTIGIEGRVRNDQTWQAERVTISENGATTVYDNATAVPAPHRERVEKFVANQGVEPVGIFGYLFKHGHLPALEWGVLAGFAAIAGAGGMSNAQFSNYARDKGWGMGSLVGAIPSAVGGKTIALSHVGRAFHPVPHNHQRWKGWFRHILRDQVWIWAIGCFLGMALPAMLSLEFVRNAPVTGNKVAAMTADGLSQQAGAIFWPLTLFCGFLVLAPSQVAHMDGILRRWTDVIWTGSKGLRHLEGNKVKYVYYTIMIAYGLWGLMALYVFPNPFILIETSTVFMNLALGFSAFHTLFVNSTLLPKPLRPNWLMRLGLLACGTFFLGICAIALSQQLPRLWEWIAAQWT